MEDRWRFDVILQAGSRSNLACPVTECAGDVGIAGVRAGDSGGIARAGLMAGETVGTRPGGAVGYGWR